MDRPVNSRFRRRQWIRRIGVLALGPPLLVGIFIYLPGWMRPAMDRDRIRTARVEVGPVEATITAAGLVAPEFEQLFSSPISSRVVKVVERPGAVLRKGQPIVELDLSQAVLAVEKLGEELALKENRQAGLRLELARRLKELDIRWRIKSLELQNLQVRSSQAQQLLDWGMVSKDYVREARLAEERVAIELEQIEGEKRDEGEAIQVQVEALALEGNILAREQKEARRRLGRRRSGLSGTGCSPGWRPRKGRAWARARWWRGWRI